MLPLIAKFSESYDFEEIIPVSATNASAKSQVLTHIAASGRRKVLSGRYADRPERKSFGTGTDKRKLLNLLNEEVPHGIGIEVISFKEKEEKGLVEIDANIYCEKESHKGIIIGRNGALLKKVGMLARQDIERLLDSKVFLKLWVKVKDDWRNSDFMLNELGYK